MAHDKKEFQIKTKEDLEFFGLLEEVGYLEDHAMPEEEIEVEYRVNDEGEPVAIYRGDITVNMTDYIAVHSYVADGHGLAGLIPDNVDRYFLGESPLAKLEGNRIVALTLDGTETLEELPVGLCDLKELRDIDISQLSIAGSVAVLRDLPALESAIISEAHIPGNERVIKYLEEKGVAITYA
jgi:hypothetical protein